MTTQWHPDQGVTASAAEMISMAHVLEGRHGIHAIEVAEFFSLYHSQKGDACRSWAWSGVAEEIRRLRDRRLSEN